ncbi:MAG: hypothetical protein HYX40_05355 [Sphingobacteriales bacterium]|nr:hypothetical protein [Sphingobacteriales bacterium]
MNAAQIHLALNHIPVLFSVTGAVLLIIALLRKNDLLKITAAYLLVGAAVFAIPVFLTGEGTEELVEELPGVSASIIEQHESIAKISLIIILITGIIALAGIILKNKEKFFKNIVRLSLLLALISFGTLAQTAHLGGMIHHTEIRKGNTTQVNQNEPVGEQGKESDEKENDKE